MEAAAMYMIHNPHALAIGGADEMRHMADLLDKVGDVLLDVYMTRTQDTRRQVRDWMSATTWFKASEALAAGFVDAIAQAPERDPKPEPEPAPQPEPEEPTPAAQVTSPWRRNLAARELALLSATGGGTW
jgi:negative regulator of sigma E activity